MGILKSIALALVVVSSASAINTDYCAQIAKDEIVRYTIQYHNAARRGDKKLMRYLLNIIKTNRKIVELAGK